MTATERVETWFIESANPDLRKLVIHQFCHGRSTGEVLRCLQTNVGFPYSRDDLEIWKRTTLRRVRRAHPEWTNKFLNAESVIWTVPIPDKELPAEQPDPVTEHRTKQERRADAAELKALLGHEARKQAYLEAIHQIAPEILEIPRALPQFVEPGAPQHTWVLLLSDVQLGQRTRFRETGGLFEQTTEVAREQFEILWNVLVRLHEINSSGKDIRELVIICNGDLVEGDSLRKSQIAKVDLFVTEQTMEMVNLLSRLIVSTLQLFPRVTVYVTPGNHDRASEKPDAAGLSDIGGAIDTYAWLMGKILEREFRGQERVRIHTSESFLQAAIIEGWRFAWSHGAEIPTGTSYAGVPLHGIVNATERYAAMLGGLDFYLLSHFHQAAVLPLHGGRRVAVMNGAFPPSSDYVMAKVKAITRPQQWLLDVHRRHGIVEYHPLYLDHPSHRLGESVWDRLREDA